MRVSVESLHMLFSLPKDRPPLLPTNDRSEYAPVVIIVLIGIATAITLRAMGRIWWCESGDWSPIVLDAWGPHNSQHVVDPYVFSHVLHGVVLFFVFNVSVFRKRPLWGLVWVTALEATWEVFENTPYTIERYRSMTAAVGYSGDSVTNSIADLLACIGGWFLARKIGLVWSIVVYLVLEIGCAIWIRDNLTLNVIQILYPLEFIKKWQSGG
jgi:hypothetical protein